MKYKTVTIVGGGSSGWMTAAALSKLCPHLDITLVESPFVGPVGVGESTLGHINKFLRLLDLKDEDWMAACNATYKNSIRFTNFREKDGTFFEYPFSNGLDFTDKPNGISDWIYLSALYPKEFGPESFAEFFATGNTLLAKYNKQTRNEDKIIRHFDFKYDTAYHMDASLFGQYLRDNIALPNGVKHIKADIHSHKKDNTHTYIQQVFCEDGTILESDLWIDCTGFRSIMLENWMGSHFIPFNKHLANDRAWAVRIPYTDRKTQMHNVTDCHALDNGWVWTIPLWNRIGTGYVFSTRFTTEEDAKKEFIDYLAKYHSPEVAENAEPFMIKIKHGKRHRAWKGNVVGVGLSYGFVEPLESTGLLTTHENIVKLVEALNRREGYVTRMEREGFNMACDYDVTKFRDFVSQHYAWSMRQDTPYWNWCTELNDYDPEMQGDYLLRHTQYSHMMDAIMGNSSYVLDYTGNMFIAAGMGIRPMGTPELVYNTGDRMDQELREEQIGYTRRRHEEYKQFITDYIAQLPTHYEYLKENIYGGKDEYDSE